jgi:indolepyruvate decarboxylase
MSIMPTETVRIGDYLADRLYALGIRHVFSGPVPPAGLTALLSAAGIDVIPMGDEVPAGAAADAYARMRGFGVVLAGYGSRGLKLVNAAAQAYAERSPLLILAEAPATTMRRFQPLPPVSPESPSPQMQAFTPLTIAARALDAPDLAGRQLEQTFSAVLRQKRPAYLELAADALTAPTVPFPAPRLASPTSTPAALDAALADAAALITTAERPVIVIGVEVQRFGLQDAVLKLMANTGIPAVATLLGKSVIGEGVAGFLGVYAPGPSRSTVRRAVEESDCLLLLGARGMDLSPGGAPPAINRGRRIIATGDDLRVGYRRYDEVTFTDFLTGLANAAIPKRPFASLPGATVPVPPTSDSSAPLDRPTRFGAIAGALTDETVVIADPGSALLTVADLPIELCSEFMSPASYGVPGFAIPASLGVGLAEPELRALVLVEAAARATGGLELATDNRLGLAPIVGALSDADDPLTRAWDPPRLPQLIGGGWAASCRTAGELARALAGSGERTAQPAIIQAKLT